MLDDDLVPESPFPSVLNFRDVGYTVNRLRGLTTLREGQVFRSARPDDANPQDRKALTEGFHVGTIVDLRSKTEHVKQAKKHDALVASSAAAPQSNSAVADSLKIPGIRYHEINLNGGTYERALLRKLRWSSLTKLLSLMTLGYRTEAIGILGREVMQPRGLIGLAKDSIDHSRSEIRQVLEVLADSRNYPVMIHCTQGKDRTGLVIMLLLLLLEAPLDVIAADYVASERFLLPEKEARMKEISEMGLSQDFTGCPRGFVMEAYDYVKKTYGGLARYFETIGVDQAMQDRVRQNMLH